MQPCKYQKIYNCESCDQIVYSKCPKFRKAHLAFLVHSIYPFKLVKHFIDEPVTWSKSIDVAKSQAAQLSCKYNSPVVKLSLNQVLSVQISNLDVEGTVFYIECPSKLTLEQDKVLSVLKSFLDRLSFEGKVVSVYSPLFNLQEYKRIDA